MKKILYTALFLAPLSLWAQEETGDEVKSVEIRVVEDYQAQVRAAHKISEQPSFTDTTSEKLPVVVRIQPKGMTIDFQPDPIPAIKLGRVKLPKLPTQRSGGISYLYTHAGFATSEHLAATAHTVELEAGDKEIVLDLGYQFSQYNGWSATGGQYHNFTIAPVTRGKNGILTYEFGLDFTGTQTAGLNQDRFEFYVFPRVNLQAEILRRTLAIYGGWDGSSKQQTLRGLLQEVPQISLDQELRLSGQNRGYVGMQGALIGKVQYRLEGAMTFMNDAVQFFRDTVLSPVEVDGAFLPAFSVGYAEQVLKTSFRGELNIPLKQFTASTYAQFNAFAGDQYLGREGQVFGGLLSYAINDLRIAAAVKYVGGRYVPSSYGSGLESYTDVNLQLGYEINENLSMSLRAYNLLNQDYQTYLGYRVRGTRGLFVLNYQF
jgi:hypothetical protein